MNFLQLLLGARRASSSAGQTRAAAARRRRDDELYLTRFLISQWDAASTRLPSIWNGGLGKEFNFFQEKLTPTVPQETYRHIASPLQAESKLAKLVLSYRFSVINVDTNFLPQFGDRNEFRLAKY
jgi:hypothetical protein